jgi:hypothetical protein
VSCWWDNQLAGLAQTANQILNFLRRFRSELANHIHDYEVEGGANSTDTFRRNTEPPAILVVDGGVDEFEVAAANGYA